MITLLILIVLTGIGFLLPRDEYGDAGILRFMAWCITGVMTIIHLVVWIPTQIEFDAFNAQHEQLRIDLDNSRESEDSYERVAILQEITKHNQDIARNKQLNKNWFIDQYIDDRVEDLQTIK